MKNKIYPINCAVILSQSDNELVFRTFSGKLYKFKSHIPLIVELVRKSTGGVSAEGIAAVVSRETNIPEAVVLEAIDDLMICRILVDSHEQLLLYHTLTCNPPRYPSVLSFSEIEELTQTRPDYMAGEPVAVYKDAVRVQLSFFDLLQERHSCRDFLESAVEAKKLFAICRASYGYQLKPVASAGGLFPLSIYFINRIDSKELPAGVYQYDPKREELWQFNRDFDPETIRYALNDEDCIFGAPCIFFICGDLGRHMKKYSNAGYRYSFLEAGHAVQNMTLAVGELGLGGVEYGGFCDEAVKALLQMPEDVYPLACYATGYEDPEKGRSKYFAEKDRIKRIVEKVVCNEIFDISPFLIDDERFKRSNLRVVVSKFKDERELQEYGTGIASTYGVAYVKSVMEAYERYILSYRRFDRQDRADKLDGEYLNPTEYVPYSDKQIQMCGLSRFRTEDIVEWLCGYNMAGECVYIPADLCYDVMRKGKEPYHMANTSGCAAHFDPEAAKNAALLELVERDAIVRSWLYQQSPYQLETKEFPENVRRRKERYEKDGVPIFVLLLSSDYAYTVLTCSVKDSAPPYFVSGAAASFSSVTEAIQKAFDEWEASYILGGTAEGSGIITPEKVISPKDHGDLYRYTNYNGKIAYLLQGQQVKADEIYINQLGNTSALSPVFLNYQGFVDNVYVVRAFSKELIPVNFGYGMDFLEHSKVDKELLKEINFPHFFA